MYIYYQKLIYTSQVWPCLKHQITLLYDCNEDRNAEITLCNGLILWSTLQFVDHIIQHHHCGVWGNRNCKLHLYTYFLAKYDPSLCKADKNNADSIRAFSEILLNRCRIAEPDMSECSGCGFEQEIGPPQAFKSAQAKVLSRHSLLVCGMHLTSTAPTTWALSKVLTPGVWLPLSVQWWAAVTGLGLQAELSKADGRKTGPPLIFTLCSGVRRREKEKIDEHLFWRKVWENKAFRFTALKRSMFFSSLSNCFLISVTVHRRQCLHWLGWLMRPGR